MKIGHTIPWEPTYQAWGDSSLNAGGGFSTELLFWWYVEWPEHVKAKTLKVRVKSKQNTDELISINALEFVVIILNYAACKLALLEEPGKHETPAPILLNHADNTSAICWTKRAARSSPIGKALGLVLCSLLMNSPLALQSEHIAGGDNVLADKISQSSLHESISCSIFNLLVQ